MRVVSRICVWFSDAQSYLEKMFFKKEPREPEDYMLVEVPEKQRRSDFLIKTAFLAFIFFIILVFMYEESHATLAVVMSVVFVGPIFGLLFYKSYKTAKATHIEVLTPEGERKKQEEEAAELANIQVNEDELGFGSAWYVRYPLAVGCLVLASSILGFGLAFLHCMSLSFIWGHRSFVLVFRAPDYAPFGGTL